jgi:2-dehydro-3-deoxyglucarate aldolase/4-hydroxy-2-oxoheptanedioate aldolase
MSFRQRLQNDEVLLGTFLTLPSPEIAEMIAACGFDWLFMDGEHGPLSILDWQRQMQAVGGRSACVLRVPSASERDIKKALDIGADGVIVPIVNDADTARRAVAWSKYPPLGQRGVGLARAHGYGRDFAAYMERANDDIAVIVQAEHVDAVRNIDDIAAVDGIDAVFIGPYDLSASMGKTGRVDDDEVVAAIEKVAVACRQNGVALGYFGVDAASVRPYMERGYRLICAGVDAAFITAGASASLAALKA